MIYPLARGKAAILPPKGANASFEVPLQVAF